MHDRDLTGLLWLMKLGAPLNAGFLWATFEPGAGGGDPLILWPARIFFAVSAWRCLFPNRYEGNVVLHDTFASTALWTRILATASEVAYIAQFAHVLRLLNANGAALVDAAATGMVFAVCVSQCFVWASFATGRHRLFVYEEAGWFLLFALNTFASAWLLATTSPGPDHTTLLVLSLVFGAGYLPWQTLHLRSLARSARAQTEAGDADESRSIGQRLAAAWTDRRRSAAAEDWGGAIGVTWMVAYWATLIPAWVFVVVRLVA